MPRFSIPKQVPMEPKGATPTVKPTDKFPTQISSDGYGMSKATKYPDQAWEVVKLYADAR